MIDLKDKTALVTGSSRGVGKQIALGLANLGCNLILHGRTPGSCSKTMELLKGYPVSVHCVHGELSDETKVKSLINQVDDLAVKLRDTGVRINTLDPGWLRTDLGGEQAEHPVEAVLFSN